MIPRSRFKDFQYLHLDFDEDWNIKLVKWEIHYLHHVMWENFTPWEIQNLLKNSKFRIPNDRFYEAWKKVYGHSADRNDVLHIVCKEWTPILPKGKKL